MISVMLAAMYDTTSACQPSIVFNDDLKRLEERLGDRLGTGYPKPDSYSDTKRYHDDSKRFSSEKMFSDSKRFPDDSKRFPDDKTYSDDSKRFSDDSNDAADHDIDVADDDDERHSPDSDVKNDDHEDRTDKKVYQCQHCKYTTDRKNNLKRHVITMHETCSKVLECCDVVFKNKASLRDHVMSCHKNGYDCRICGRTFCRKALLKRHITVHSGQKDYVCGVCGYATSHKSNLDRHKRRHGAKLHMNDSDKSDSMSPPGLGVMHVPPAAAPQPASLPASIPITKLLGDNFWWNVLDPMYQVAAYGAFPLPYYQPKHHRHKASLLAKRLLHTYDRRAYVTQHHVPPQDLHVQKQHREVKNKRINGNFCSKKRLFPGLYRCNDCGVTYNHQLDLHQHLQSDQCKNDITDVAQRPLTRLSHVLTSVT